MSDAQNLNSDYGYYNYIINNQNHQSIIKAELDETRIAPILSKQEDWQVAVARFKVPGVTIPLFIFEEDNLAPPGNPPVYQSPYWITFSIGNNYTNILPLTNVIFEPNYSNNTLTERPNSRFIFYYSSFIKMVNDALKVVWIAAGLDAAYNIFANKVDEFSPFFELKPGDSFIQAMLPFESGLANPCAFIDDGTNPYINIHMSEKLFYFFSGFPSKLLSNPPVGLQLTPYVLKFTVPQNSYNRVITLPNWGTNPSLKSRQMLQIPQDYSCLYLWQKLSRILLTTSIPIEQEMVGVRDLNGNNFTIQLLTDYEIPPSRDGSQRDYIYFFPEGPLRYANFTSNGPLRRMDIRILFQTNDLQTFPLELPPGFEATIKLQFKRRKARGLLQYGSETSYKYR